MQLFNRRLHELRRKAAAEEIAQADFILRESAARLADRLQDIQREFPLALDLGCHHGLLAEEIKATGKIGTLIQADLSISMVVRANFPKLVMDEEMISFAGQSLDAVLSNLSLQWVNDLPGTLVQLRRALKPDGLLLAVVPGPRTLQELRQSLLAVSANLGKAAPRISPFVEVRDAGALLQRAGFALPVIDSEIITLTYSDPLALLRELQSLGETNALIEQHKGMTGKSFWPQVFEHYQRHYTDERGRVKATLELVFMTAWAPHDSQQQPAKRGSGTVKLADALR